MLPRPRWGAPCGGDICLRLHRLICLQVSYQEERLILLPGRSPPIVVLNNLIAIGGAPSLLSTPEQVIWCLLTTLVYN